MSHFFLALKFWINMKREYFDHFFLTKKSLDLQKIKNHIGKFPYWFWFGNKILNV
jgi:hypothetical protein